MIASTGFSSVNDFIVFVMRTLASVWDIKGEVKEAGLLEGGGMSNEKEGKAVILSAELYSRIEERVKATGLGSVDEYVTFVLEEVLKEEGKEEEELVKKRLRALGYLE